MYGWGPDRAKVARLLAGHVYIHFRGFRATLADLIYISGWQVNMEDNHRSYESTMYLMSKDCALAMVVPHIALMEAMQEHHFEASYVGHSHSINIMSNRHPHLRGYSVEFRPEFLGGGERDWDMVHRSFPLAMLLKPVEDVEKLLIAREDEATVDDLLGKILKKQKSLREEIAERRVKETLIERPSAQIVKLFAA